MAAFDSREVRWLRRNWAEVGKAFVPFLAAPWMIAAGLTGSLLFALVGFAAGFVCLFAGSVQVIRTWLGNPRPVPVAGRLRAGEGGVFWEDGWIAVHPEILAGFIVPRPGGPPMVRLVLRFPWTPLSFEVPDEHVGRAFLSALGLDAAQTVASLKLSSILFPAHARVGADGILVEEVWQRRFIRFEDFRRVQALPDDRGLSLQLNGGEEVRLLLPSQVNEDLARQECALWLRRIAQAAEIHHLAQADRGVTFPERGERSAAEWVGALHATGSGASADHRTAPLEAETLFRIVEDPGDEPARRVAAAIALRGTTDAHRERRLRIAASTTAAPELREALDLAASDTASDEALAAAFERVRR